MSIDLTEKWISQTCLKLRQWSQKNKPTFHITTQEVAYNHSENEAGNVVCCVHKNGGKSEHSRGKKKRKELVEIRNRYFKGTLCKAFFTD